MAKFSQYDATDTKLSPSDAGYSAFETAGRRLGPLYDQVAQDVRTGGELQAQEVKEEDWPLAFARFRAANSGGASLRFTGDRGSRSGGGGGRSGGLRMPSAEGSGAGPFLSRLASNATRQPQQKVMPNPMLDQENQISQAANDWYYGSGPNSASGVYGGEGVSTDQYGSTSVPTGGVNDSTDQYGNPLAADAGIPYAPPADTSGDSGGGGLLSDIGSAISGFWNDITTAQ